MWMNWRVIGGVGASAVVAVLFAPGWMAAFAPFLVLAVCPISMWLTMRHLPGSSSRVANDSEHSEIEQLRSEVAELRRQQSDRTSN